MNSGKREGRLKKKSRKEGKQNYVNNGQLKGVGDKRLKGPK